MNTVSAEKSMWFSYYFSLSHCYPVISKRTATFCRQQLQTLVGNGAISDSLKRLALTVQNLRTTTGKIVFSPVWLILTQVACMKNNYRLPIFFCKGVVPLLTYISNLFILLKASVCNFVQLIRTIRFIWNKLNWTIHITQQISGREYWK